MLKVLEKIFHKLHGRECAPPKALTFFVDQEVEHTATADMLRVVEFQLAWKFFTKVPDDGYIGQHIEEAKSKAMFFFADELFAEVRDDLIEILGYVHDNVYDRELMEKLETLLRKTRGSL